MNILIPTLEETFRYGYNRTASGGAARPSTWRARRGLGMRMGMMGGSGSSPTWNYVTSGAVSFLCDTWDGLTWKDESGNGNDAICISKSTINLENGYLKDKDAVFNTGWDITCCTNKSFTVEFVIVPTNTRELIIGGYNYTNGIGVEVYPASGSNILRYYYANGDRYWAEGFFTGYYGTKVSISFVVNGGTYSAYRNGTAVAGRTFSSPTMPSNNFRINGDSRLTMGVNNFYYMFRMYSRPLTASEIATNYRVDKARFGLT